MCGRLTAADAVEAARCGGAARPCEHAAGVERAVGGEAPAHDAGFEGGHGKLAHRALPLAGDFLVRDDERAPGAVAEIEQRAAEISPCALGHPEQLGGAAVLAVRDPHHRLLHRGIRGVGDVGVAEHVAVEAAGFHAVDAVLRRPVAFLVGHEETAVVVDGNAVGRAETRREDVRAGAVGADPQQRAVVRHHAVECVARGLGVVEIPLLIRLQAHCELMEMLGDLMVVVEAFDEIGFPVAVQVAQACELIPAGDEQVIATEFHAEGLEQAAGDPAPGQGGRSLFHEAVHPPDIAVPHRDHGGLAVGGEIKAARAHPGVPWIVRGQRKLVRDERAPFLAGHGGRGDRLLPARGAAFRQRREVERREFRFRHRGERFGSGPRDGEARLGSAGQGRDPEAVLLLQLAVAGNYYTHRIWRDAQAQRFPRVRDIQRPDENGRASVFGPVGHFQHPCAIDARREDDLGAVLVSPLELHAGNGTVGFFLLAQRPCVLEAAAAPSRADGIDEMRITREARVGSVAAVESDALPVHEITGGGGGERHGVVIVNHPRAAFAHPTRPVIETDGDAFLHDVSRLHLIGPIKRRTQIHALERGQGPVHFLRLGAGHALRQRGKVGGGQRGVLAWVVAGQEGFPDVLDDGIFLHRRELGLRHHLVVALGEGHIHRVGIRAVLERAFAETQRRGQRSLLLLVAVANLAQGFIDLRALLERFPVP